MLGEAFCQGSPTGAAARARRAARPFLLALMVLSVALAGCGDKTEAPTSIETPDDLDTGKGAIAGLLVDDRYRPIEGSILLEQTGERVQSNSDGEFQFVNLAPGTYRLRVDAPGHEATPVTATVKAGEFAEQTLIARRVLSEDGTVITQEYAVFIPCAVDYIANGQNVPCSLDFGDDEYDSGYTSELQDLQNVTYVVTEFKASQESDYEVQVRDDSGDDWIYYAAARFSGDYVKVVNRIGEANTEHSVEAYGENQPFSLAGPLHTLFFVDHADLKGMVPGTCCGAGATMGIKGTFVQSIFLGEPEKPIENYSTF